jgi:hypothetical protein
MMSALRMALDQIGFARGYTQRLLDSFPQAEWFRMPSEGVTHVAWQVGHLAMAQYRLALERLRGVQPGDNALISPEFLKTFAGQSRPDPDATHYPSAEEIRSVFDRVHEQVLREVPNHPEDDLATAPTRSHLLAKTKGESLLWCAAHEMVHAGQIGLLRRLLGHPPLW